MIRRYNVNMADKFSTGKMCKRGHFSERLVSTRACCECQKGLNRARYELRREEIRAKVTEYRSENLEKAKACQRASRLKNVEKYRKKDRVRNADDPQRKAAGIARLNAWNADNPERTKKRVSDWAKANPAKVNAKGARYRAAELRATPPWADQAKIERAYELAHEYRAKGIDCHVDHIIPLQSKIVSGLHVHTNLQIIAAKANRSKSNHLLQRN